MKVLIVHAKVPFYGGAEHVIVNLCKYLDSKKIEHGLCMVSMPKEMKADLPESTVIHDEVIPPFNQYDIVNFHDFPATMLAGGCTKPMCYYCNEPAELFTNFWRKGIEKANRLLVKHRIKHVIVADRYNAERFYKIYDVAPTIIPYGIDYDFFSQCQHNPDKEYFTVMQVGTISHYKNQLETVRAVAEVKKQIPNIRLWLVGNVSDTDYKFRVEDAIQWHNLGGILTWEPHVSREHLRELYSRTDVLLHPVKEQGGWLSPFEAISAGVPVIVRPELSCADMIREHRLAIVSEDLAQSLLTMFQHYHYSELVTQTAKDWVRDNLTWEAYGEAMVNYFQEVLDCRKSPIEKLVRA